MTEPQLPLDPPLPEPRGQPMTLCGVPCRLIEFPPNDRRKQPEFAVSIEIHDDSLSPEIKRKLDPLRMRHEPWKFYSSAARAVVATERKLEKYLLPPKPPKPPKPAERPVQFVEKIENQTAQIVGAILGARSPELTEEWYIGLVQAAFEAQRADWRAREEQKAKKA